MQAEGPLRLGFLMFPGFPMACLTSAIEPLRAANEISGQRAFVWRLLAETDEPVRCSAELGFKPDMIFQDADGLDHLYLVSPPTAEFSDPRRGRARLRWLDRTGITIGAFSGGIFPLARSGLMDDRTCSVHWCYEAAFRAEFPDVAASQSVIVQERRRNTVSGAGAVFDLMLKLIEQRLGRDCMTEVACWFQHPFVRDADASQKVPVARLGATEDSLTGKIREAIRLFESHIEDPLRIPEIAAAVGLSGRHFDRQFKQETGQSPLRYYHRLRLAKARQRVLYTNDPIAEIAASVGYPTVSRMVHHYQAAFGVSPKTERGLTQSLRNGLGPRPDDAQ